MLLFHMLVVTIAQPLDFRSSEENVYVHLLKWIITAWDTEVVQNQEKSPFSILWETVLISSPAWLCQYLAGEKELGFNWGAKLPYFSLVPSSLNPCLAVTEVQRNWSAERPIDWDIMRNGRNRIAELTDVIGVTFISTQPRLVQPARRAMQYKWFQTIQRISENSESATSVPTSGLDLRTKQISFYFQNKTTTQNIKWPYFTTPKHLYEVPYASTSRIS